MIGKTLLHYEITEHLGTGGMGEVYRARDTKLGREVALKILPAVFSEDSERLARFEREARVLASLNHSQIAHIHGLEEVDGLRFLVLELVDGEDLAQRLERGPIALAEALEIARQVAEGVEFAHHAGVIHRDLKPANIKLASDGTVKVLDFGLAKAMESDDAGPSSDPNLSNSPTMMTGGTVHGVILGTAAYMSPEQARGKVVDRRTDVWAFGCVLYEMITGKVLFSGETVSDTLAAVLRAAPDFDALPASTPYAVRNLLTRCLERDRNRRLQAIGEARIVLEDVAAGNDTPAPRDPNQKNWTRFLPWAFTFAFAAFALFMMSRTGPIEKTTTPQSRRLTSIIAPPGGSIEMITKSLALSPNGEMLVFVAENEDGRFQLYLRRLDEVTAQPLPGTVDATTPFWSPDSRHVGFSLAGQLMRVSVEGGRPKVIVDANVGRPGSAAWHPDGYIVYPTVARDAALMKVLADGGEPELWLSMFPDKDAVIELPLFVPNGEVLLCTIEDLTREHVGVYAARVDELKPVKLLDRHATVGFVEPDFLIYNIDNDLVAHRIDLSSLKLLGEPTRIASNVHRSNYPFQSFFSTSLNGDIAYFPAAEGAGVIEMVWVDREGNQTGAPLLTGDLYNPRISPDDRRVAVDLSTPSTHGDIWVLDVARGSSVRLTSHPLDESRPVWIDNNELFFYRGREVLRTAVGGTSEPTRVFNSESEVRVPADLSPDGKWLVITSIEEILLFNLETGEFSDWIDEGFYQGEPRFSPDGKWLAFESAESGREEVYVESFPARDERFLVSTSGGSQPVWRRDGGELYYYSLAGEIMVVPVNMDATDHAPVGQPVALFSTRLRRDDFDVRSDGQRFLLIRPIRLETSFSFVLLQNWRDHLSHQ